jgi:hypothetical protein
MFENFEVYQKAVDFSDDAFALTEEFPREYDFLSDQLNRAALPITTAKSAARRSPQRSELTIQKSAGCCRA